MVRTDSKLASLVTGVSNELGLRLEEAPPGSPLPFLPWELPPKLLAERRNHYEKLSKEMAKVRNAEVRMLTRGWAYKTLVFSLEKWGNIRGWSKSKLFRYCLTAVNGGWGSSQSIDLRLDGSLSNGFRRTMAVYITGIPLPFYVHDGVMDNAHLFVDDGTNRTGTDTLLHLCGGCKKTTQMSVGAIKIFALGPQNVGISNADLNELPRVHAQAWHFIRTWFPKWSSQNKGYFKSAFIAALTMAYIRLPKYRNTLLKLVQACVEGRMSLLGSKMETAGANLLRQVVEAPAKGGGSGSRSRLFKLSAHGVLAVLAGVPKADWGELDLDAVNPFAVENIAGTEAMLVRWSHGQYENKEVKHEAGVRNQKRVRAAAGG